MDDAALLTSLTTERSGEALRALYRAYGGELYGFALRALGDSGLAEEVVQEVFTRAWRNADRYDPERASLRTWLYRIARNAIVDVRRRAAVRPALAAGDPAQLADEDAGEPIEAAMLRWQVQSALERLTAAHRDVIRLAYFDGLTLREIAQATGVPLGTVKSRTSYALRALRLALDELGVGP